MLISFNERATRINNIKTHTNIIFIINNINKRKPYALNI